MNKKAAVTIFEIAVLAILTTVLVIVYHVFAQSSVENIVLRTADSIQAQECSMTLLTVYNNEYKRGTDLDTDGEYEELQDFYNIPDEYTPHNEISDIIGYETREGVSGNSRCTSFYFDPVRMYEGKGGYSVVSGE